MVGMKRSESNKSFAILAGIAILLSVGIASFTGPACVLLAGQNTNGLNRSDILELFGEPVLQVLTNNATVQRGVLRTAALRGSEELLLYDVMGYALLVGTKQETRTAGAYVIPAFPHGVPIEQIIVAFVAVLLGWIILVAGYLGVKGQVPPNDRPRQESSPENEN